MQLTRSFRISAFVRRRRPAKCRDRSRKGARDMARDIRHHQSCSAEARSSTDWTNRRSHEARRHSRPLAPGRHASRATRHRARGDHRHPRGGPRSQDRAPRAGDQHRARPQARQQLARQALPEPEARRGKPGLHQGAADHPCVRRRRGDPKQARRFLAIPTENAPRKGTDGKRISPRTFSEHLRAAEIGRLHARGVG